MTQMYAPPPGWYSDPQVPGTLRWWDGVRWTEHRSSLPLQPAFAVGYGHQGSPQFVTTDYADAPSWLLPTGRSGLAIAAGYLGLFSILVMFAPISLVVGILALRDLKRTPGKLGKGRAIFGIVMGALFSIVLILLIASNA
jgi:hypothetical protein